MIISAYPPATTPFTGTNKLIGTQDDGKTRNFNLSDLYNYIIGQGQANVQAFGAVGNGVTDDTVAIKAACSYLAGRGGGSLYFPSTPNYYLITDAIPIPSNTTVFGDGAASTIRCPSIGWSLTSTDRYGLLNVKGVNNIRIVGLHLYSTKNADNTHTPKLIYFESVNNLLIESNFLENSAFEGIWSGGSPSAAREVRIICNYVTNVGYPNSFGGLPAIQPNCFDVVISGNELYDVGSGISPSASNIVVSGNKIRQVQVVGISTGDGGDYGNTAITGNVVEITANANTPYGIRVDGGSGVARRCAVTGNKILINGALGVNAFGIGMNSALHASITDNTIEIDVKGNGILVQGQAGGAYATIRNNVVRYTNEGVSAGVIAISGVPNGGGNTLNVASSDNFVYGLTRANGGQAYYFPTSPGTSNVTMTDDIRTEGATQIGGISDASPTNDNIPVSYNSNLTLPSIKGANIYAQMLSLGTISIINLASGVLDISGTGASVLKRQSIVVMDTQGAISSDNLNTITGSQPGDILILQSAANGRTVVVKNNTGNLKLAGSDFSLSNTDMRIMLQSNGTTLFELCRSANT